MERAHGHKRDFPALHSHITKSAAAQVERLNILTRRPGRLLLSFIDKPHILLWGVFIYLFFFLIYPFLSLSKIKFLRLPEITLCQYRVVNK